jgi:ABC-type lipoprotein export system ATPase subunit
VVTHDPRIVPFAKRIVRIEDGRIVGEERAQPGEERGSIEERGGDDERGVVVKRKWMQR